LVAQIKDVHKSYDSFRDGLSKIDDKIGNSPLTRVIAGETLSARLDGGAYVLWLKAVAAGGAAHAKVSTFDSNISYSGGAVISYAIFGPDGDLLEADTIPMYGGKVVISGIEAIDFDLGPLVRQTPQYRA
jgi:hypothetical protein